MPGMQLDSGAKTHDMAGMKRDTAGMKPDMAGMERDIGGMNHAECHKMMTEGGGGLAEPRRLRHRGPPHGRRPSHEGRDAAPLDGYNDQGRVENRPARRTGETSLGRRDDEGNDGDDRNEPPHFFAGPEGDHGRNPSNAESFRKTGILIRVHLEHEESPRPVRRQPVEHRRHGPAGPAPVSREIHHDRHRGAHHGSIKIGTGCLSGRSRPSGLPQPPHFGPDA